MFFLLFCYQAVVFVFFDCTEISLHHFSVMQIKERYAAFLDSRGTSCTARSKISMFKTLYTLYELFLNGFLQILLFFLVPHIFE